MCRSFACVTTAAFLGAKDTQTISLVHSGIGSVTVECTVWWKSVPDPNLHPNPPSSTPRSTAVDVEGPSTIKLDQGSGELFAFNSPVHFIFRPYASGNRALGMYVSPIVEERIMRNGVWGAWSSGVEFAWRSDMKRYSGD